MEKCAECGRECSILRKSLFSSQRLCLECHQAERKRPIYVRMTVVGKEDQTVVGLAGAGKDGVNFYR
jgi:hypothetical protein